jgi:hypothetical protein
MFIKSGTDFQKSSKISIAFYAKFNIKHLSNLQLSEYEIQNCTKVI